MTKFSNVLQSAVVAGIVVLLLSVNHAVTQVSAPDAAKLKTTLTPLGAERAGNKEGTIPAWDGGLTKATPGFKNGGRRPDPFPNEKPLFSITAKNMDQYADKLTDGTKAMLKKYPNYRVDIYPTHRTMAAPQWVYDNTSKNVTRAKLVNGSAGPEPSGAFGGIPFPIPSNGAEVMWNHLLRWRGTSWHKDFSGYEITADGKQVLVLESLNDEQMPYYSQDAGEKFNGDFWLARAINSGPPIRAGEGIIGRSNVNADKTLAWVYLTGQRRVRQLPNPCCDVPTPFSAGLSTYDEIDVFTGRMNRFDWTVIGKKEVYIPYNTNKSLAPKANEVLGPHYLNPDYVRWELHRVWVVEATLRPGQRHTSPKSRYYVDEDSWIAVLADRWDAKGQLWRSLFTLPIAAPDIPATVNTSWGYYDLLTGRFFVNVLFNDRTEQYRVMPRYSSSLFTADSLASEGVR
jgi:Protein of unknown function (DUF1329)